MKIVRSARESGRFHLFTTDMEQDRINPDIFRLWDENFEDSHNLPDPDVIALEIAENLEDTLEQPGDCGESGT